MFRSKVPRLNNSDTVVRLARDQHEVRRANILVFRRYVEQGYWRNEEQELERNKYLHLPTRQVFVIAEKFRIIGTASIIVDSHTDLPAASFQPKAIERLRQNGGKLAEISALAIEKNYPHQHNLIHFLVAFIFQYSYYYAAIDRFVVVCTPKHARFYERNYGFERVCAPDVYNYVGTEAQLLTLNLAQSCETARNCDESMNTKGGFLRFLYVDKHPNLMLPSSNQLHRLRSPDWRAPPKQPLPIAV